MAKDFAVFAITSLFASSHVGRNVVIIIELHSFVVTCSVTFAFGYRRTTKWRLSHETFRVFPFQAKGIDHIQTEIGRTLYRIANGLSRFGAKAKA